jgi:hypothetical protein
LNNYDNCEDVSKFEKEIKCKKTVKVFGKLLLIAIAFGILTPVKAVEKKSGNPLPKILLNM